MLRTPLMSWVLSLLVGLLSAAAGCLCAGFVASLCVRWYRISSFEGGSGYFVVFMGLFGLIAGFVLGVVWSRFLVSATEPWFARAAGAALGTVAGLALVVGFFCWLAADLPPTLAGRDLELNVEVRFPAGFKLPPAENRERASVAVYLVQGRSQPSARPEFLESRPKNEPLVATVTVPLRTSASQKFLSFHIDQENDFLFPLRFGSRPGKKDLEWSAWVESAWDAGKERPPEAERVYMRYRVALVEPPPPRPSREEEDAKRELEEQAAFEAIDPKAPVTVWLPYTRYGVRADRVATAVGNISGRDTFLEEFSAILKSGTLEEVCDALRMIQHIEKPSPGLVPPVKEFGQDLVRRIKEVNASRVEDDPSYERFAEVSQRFSAWMAATHPLRARCGADFVPELKEITGLARVRKDSIVMRGDVLRVSSYYLNDWAGIPPGPDDPKP